MPNTSEPSSRPRPRGRDLTRAGTSDWGAYQTPGAIENMRQRACTHMVGVDFLDGAGHWAQQQQPEQAAQLLLAFLQEHAGGPSP